MNCVWYQHLPVEHRALECEKTGMEQLRVKPADRCKVTTNRFSQLSELPHYTDGRVQGLKLKYFNIFIRIKFQTCNCLEILLLREAYVLIGFEMMSLWSLKVVAERSRSFWVSVPIDNSLLMNFWIFWSSVIAINPNNLLTPAKPLLSLSSLNNIN